jgi:prepilin-type N-terminal cleavage/methylation domain-containing protein
MKQNKGFTPLESVEQQTTSRASSLSGFTLIEMLIVVGMIGALAAAVLTALGPSRNKANDARIISGVNQIVALVEGQYNSSGFPRVEELTHNPATTEAWNTITADVQKMNGLIVYNTDEENFVVFSNLESDPTKAYCVDSAGAHKTINLPVGLVVICPAI